MTYRPEIDGLRAIAVLSIVLFHAGFDWFQGGFVGVDVFFVISGFLISSIVLKGLSADNFSFLEFYKRRFLRIFPALLCMLIFSVPFAWMWMPPSEVHDFSKSLLSSLLFYSNFFFWLDSGYFDISTDYKPLIHTWSLSVEEQVYIFIPFLLFLMRKLHYCKSILVTITIFIFSLSMSQFLLVEYPDFSYFMMPFRLWEFLVGVISAQYLFYINRNQWRQRNGFLSAIGVLLIFIPVFVFDDKTPFPGLFALIPVLGTVMVIIFSKENTIIHKLLSSRLFVSIGLISYSTYLWHQPILVFARYRSLSPLDQFDLVFLVILSLLIGYASWKLVEQPFRFFRFPLKWMSISFVFILLVGCAVYGTENKGAILRPSIQNQLADIDTRLAPNHGLNDVCEKEFNDSPLCKTSETPEILVWGDSYAMHLVDGILASNRDVKLVQKTVSVCGPILGVAHISANYPKIWGERCIETNDKVIDYIKSTPSIKYVVMSSPFFQYVHKKAEVLTRDGNVVSGQVTSTLAFLDTLEVLKEIGVKPVIVSPPPQNGEDIGACLKKAAMLGSNYRNCDVQMKDTHERQGNVWQLLREVEKHAKVIWLSDEICHEDICSAAIGNTLIYRDQGHLSKEGSVYLGNKMKFYSEIVDLAKRPK